MTSQFGKIFEQDFDAKDVVIYSPSDRKKVNKKWFDGEDKDVLFDLESLNTCTVCQTGVCDACLDDMAKEMG